MTEKRFWYDMTDLNFEHEIEGIISQFYDNDKQMTYAEVLNMLNELNDENKSFKEEIEYLTPLANENSFYIADMEDDIITFRQEIKKLQERIKSLKMEIAELRESKKDNYNITDGLW